MNILIVESAAKSRTLQKYLGEDWKVLATGGHVETLPDDRKKYGKEAKKAYWANRSGELPSPPWVWTDRGEGAVKAILDAADADPVFWIATDPDREGEFIAWCLDRILSPHGPTHRITFQEVTEEAVQAAIANPRPVDQRMVDSALVRKFLDRLVGFRGTKLASSIVGRGASMGRVQTPTLGFVVERELEREAHVPIPYFEVRAAAMGVDLQVRFHEPDDAEVWRDEADKPHPTRTFDRELAESAFGSLDAAGEVTVTSVRPRTSTRKPAAPFSTDALLQAAGSRFGWSPRKTSALASMLYEQGHITYIRTDSTRLAASAVSTVRRLVRDGYGPDHLGEETAGNVATGPTQDAHEAIRPSRPEVEDVGVDDADARKLYRLIRAHTLASQMAPSRTATRSIQAACGDFPRPLTGTVSWRTFAGWEAAYGEFMAARPTSPPDIPLEEGAVWPLDPGTEEAPNPLLIEDETRPPSRYRPHTLVKAMKDAGIGRPSTYSRTVDKLEERKYVEEEEGALVPTARGRRVWIEAAPLYSREAEGDRGAAEFFSSAFTAVMEERLDRLAAGEAPAPATWEEWRDEFRQLHELAQETKKAGKRTPNQAVMLQRLMTNAPPEARRSPEELAELSWQEAQGLIAELREAGVRPAPTENQMDYARKLAEELEMTDEEVMDITGGTPLDGIRTSEQASALIDELKRIHDEQRPPSRKQTAFIKDMIEELEIPEGEAASLAGVASLEDLTGGRQGTASTLIDALQERVEAQRKEKKAATAKAAGTDG